MKIGDVFYIKHTVRKIDENGNWLECDTEDIKEIDESKCQECADHTTEWDKISRRVLINAIFKIKEECRPSFLNELLTMVQNLPSYDEC